MTTRKPPTVAELQAEIARMSDLIVTLRSQNAHLKTQMRTAANVGATSRHLINTLWAALEDNGTFSVHTSEALADYYSKTPF
jgi:DNA-directed RNA polymerase specialized sigma54-like protein